jgi:ribosome-binding ATPase YchF (GTP1/OBG family)
MWYKNFLALTLVLHTGSYTAATPSPTSALPAHTQAALSGIKQLLPGITTASYRAVIRDTIKTNLSKLTPAAAESFKQAVSSEIESQVATLHKKKQSIQDALDKINADYKAFFAQDASNTDASFLSTTLPPFIVTLVDKIADEANKRIQAIIAVRLMSNGNYELVFKEELPFKLGRLVKSQRLQKREHTLRQQLEQVGRTIKELEAFAQSLGWAKPLASAQLAYINE